MLLNRIRQKITQQEQSGEAIDNSTFIGRLFKRLLKIMLVLGVILCLIIAIFVMFIISFIKEHDANNKYLNGDIIISENTSKKYLVSIKGEESITTSSNIKDRSNGVAEVPTIKDGDRQKPKRNYVHISTSHPQKPQYLLVPYPKGVGYTPMAIEKFTDEFTIIGNTSGYRRANVSTVEMIKWTAYVIYIRTFYPEKAIDIRNTNFDIPIHDITDHKRLSEPEMKMF